MKKPQVSRKDVLQPSDPEFKRVYGYDPILRAKKKRKEEFKKKNDKKVKLEEKYWSMKKEGRLKPWEERKLRRIVLYEEEY